jgi:aspartokinase
MEKRISSVPALLKDQVRVLKFGGSSVGTPEKIRRVARIISAYKKFYQEKIVVVVSAMGDTTDELIELAEKVSPKALDNFHRREMDMLLTAGERISMSLLSMALLDIGEKSKSFTGSQSGIITDTVHGEAKIAEIKPIRIIEELARDNICIVAGFQGVSREKEITTLGRGGSDTTAVALGVVLDAKEIVIFTDVDGVYASDPRRSNFAIQPMSQISWKQTVEMGLRGAQVLHPRCIELAWKYRKPVRVKSSFIENTDSFLLDEAKNKKFKGTIVMGLEDSQTMSVASQSEISQFSVGLPDLLAFEKFKEETAVLGVKFIDQKLIQEKNGFAFEAWVEKESMNRLMQHPELKLVWHYKFASRISAWGVGSKILKTLLATQITQNEILGFTQVGTLSEVILTQEVSKDRIDLAINKILQGAE